MYTLPTAEATLLSTSILVYVVAWGAAASAVALTALRAVVVALAAKSVVRLVTLLWGISPTANVTVLVPDWVTVVPSPL